MINASSIAFLQGWYLPLKNKYTGKMCRLCVPSRIFPVYSKDIYKSAVQ